MLERLRLVSGGLSGLRRKRVTAPASDGTIHEAAYQVGRGVRQLALLGQCQLSEMDETRHRLERLADPQAIPFVVDRGDGLADFGYASSAWALDLYRWVARASAVVLPQQHRDQIVGMLLGYSTTAISWFVERTRREVDATRERVEQTCRDTERTVREVRQTVRRIRRTRPKPPSGPRGPRGRTSKKSPCSKRGKAGKRSRNAR